MAQLSTVLFDLDGTLIDSIQLILDSYHHTLAVHGLPARSDAHWLAGLGTPLLVQFRDWCDDKVQLEAMVATAQGRSQLFRERTRGRHSVQTPMTSHRVSFDSMQNRQ